LAFGGVGLLLKTIDSSPFAFKRLQAMPEMQAMAEVQPGPGQVEDALATYITSTWRHMEDTFCQRSWKLFLGDNAFQRLFKTMLLLKHACKHNLKQQTNVLGRH
jgi:hypothetical protein